MTVNRERLREPFVLTRNPECRKCGGTGLECPMEGGYEPDQGHGSGGGPVYCVGRARRPSLCECVGTKLSVDLP